MTTPRRWPPRTSQSTLDQLKTFGEQEGITPLEPAEAEDANAYAVTKDYAEKNNLKTLSDLGKLGKPIALAANSDCSERPDCGKGLTSVYGIKLSKIEPLGFGSPDTKNALTKGEVQLGQVGTTDGSLEQAGIVVLEDDKNWQNAENLVPVVNSAWLKKNPKAAVGPEQALRRAHHRGPQDAERQGRRGAPRGQPGRRGLPQGEGAPLRHMAERVYLHIGAAKTGTSYLQLLLWGNRDALREQQHLPAPAQASPPLRRGGRPARWACGPTKDLARTWDELAERVHKLTGYGGGQRGAALRLATRQDRADHDAPWPRPRCTSSSPRVTSGGRSRRSGSRLRAGTRHVDLRALRDQPAHQDPTSPFWNIQDPVRRPERWGSLPREGPLPPGDRAATRRSEPGCCGSGSPR